MKHRLALCVCAIFLLLQATPTAANEVLELQVSRLGDVEMNCGSLSQEALLMREIITTTQDIKDNSKIKSHGISAAAGVGGFLVGTVTGGIGLAAAGFLLDQTTKSTASNADGVQDIAEQRRSLMVGIYNAKGCTGPIEHVMQDGMERDDKTEIQIASIEPAAGEGSEPPLPRKPHYND